MINSKESQTLGTTFAIKANYIINTLKNIDDISSKDLASLKFKSSSRTEQIKDLTVNFNGYLEGLKTIFLKDVEDPKDYESMDKTGTVDEYLFLGDK